MCICFRTRHLSNCASRVMGLETMDKTHLFGEKKSVNFRLHNVSGYLPSLTELFPNSVGYISHTKKNWEHRRLFSLEEQINHKMDFIKLELQNIEVPIILVGHSIGSYMSIEVLRRLPEKVIYCIGLYPFLAVNTQSSEQSSIRRLAK
ncbi:hypothetical protein RHGRI_006913 [Rhododendron griersonianum]|uniref:Uncharacterized protein n=1 Tax=Rhododendron griersonianum TaxID=479676 RepID=A0AAV6KUX2_9ERIC|nr:hypothetical protein RHGRI_006913 [Rhododendron griersonianum]